MMGKVGLDPGWINRYPHVARGGSWNDGPDKCRSAAPEPAPELASQEPQTRQCLQRNSGHRQVPHLGERETRACGQPYRRHYERQQA